MRPVNRCRTFPNVRATATLASTILPSRSMIRISWGRMSPTVRQRLASPSSAHRSARLDRLPWVAGSGGSRSPVTARDATFSEKPFNSMARLTSRSSSMSSCLYRRCLVAVRSGCTIPCLRSQALIVWADIPSREATSPMV